jgi:hypothetical protein
LKLDAGTIAFWLNFSPGHDKFVYILGATVSDEVLSFTISSQTKYLELEPHRREMVEIPVGTIDCLSRRSFIQCFHEVTITRLRDFQDLDRRGFINWRGTAPQFLQAVRECVFRSELLSEYDKDAVLGLLRPDEPACAE